MPKLRKNASLKAIALHTVRKVRLCRQEIRRLLEAEDYSRPNDRLVRELHAKRLEKMSEAIEWAKVAAQLCRHAGIEFPKELSHYAE